ncbi:type II toxin-antitoxin system RelE/ParE family toxin [Neisseriaceae bacterium B1]
MYTIAETDEFKKQAAQIWQESERLDFFAYLSENPLQGDVIPNGNGLRKIRWKQQGKGKRGGVRVIYYNFLQDGFILVLAVYPKSEKENLKPSELNELKGKKDE